ncbi:carboxypeptidase-like regulatory domain-containing protein [Hymenobacter sp. H14-R3]|uniref:carboxypeptidase-like regulatory domain-containing protein n=1 Tax=Hymenobacter sp. H14-R3 TaxID=3046308 RepID=UPI0024B9597A|nr:carboxypeptidase-like regulatory domain-containing protein [Hymenobacter sp. H14-R3]MDJ0364245.1 carboxypeptidase-like regulatory domain-containing protein [Hymenobacter sp. H14-R3]
MTPRSHSVHIAQPCPEGWGPMVPATAGRHCAACQKTVVDFTRKTDAEILAYLASAPGNTCGRLRPDQLNRSLVAPTAAPRWRAWLGAALAAGGVLGAGRATAQAMPAYCNGGPVPAASPAPALLTRAVAPTPTSCEATTTGGPLTLSGVVRDSATHEGLPGVTVLLMGTTTGTSTDINGAFSLPMPAGVAPVRLAFSFIGFVMQERTATANQPLAVLLAASEQSLMGEVVITGGIYQRPWPWHPRRFFSWGKHQLKTL